MNLNREDTLINSLCELYKSYGYKKYNPECFEEYSLFLDNLDFLISKNVITFAGSGGRLLALRPDVTLSVIKHCNVLKGDCEKLYYNENVYRQSQDGEFKEVSQVGVEVIGDIDVVCQTEICILMLKTLSYVSEENALCISHMGFIEGLFDSFGITGEKRGALYSLLKSKNAHDFGIFAKENDINEEGVKTFNAVCEFGFSARSCLNTIKTLVKNQKMERAVEELTTVINLLYALGYGDRLKLDFSVVSDENYYDGLIFNGYINGIPRYVLSGGRYDKLVKKFGKDSGAIGFALYLGEIERYLRADQAPVDELILYSDNPLAALKAAENAVARGKSVRLAKNESGEIKAKTTLNLKGDNL